MLRSIVATLAFVSGSFVMTNAQASKPVQNDSNTPLHLLAPDYPVRYGVSKTDSVKALLDRVLTYVAKETPVGLTNSETKQAVKNYATIDEQTRLDKGAFRLTSYEWGVTYLGMLLAAETTGDQQYKKYVEDRFGFLSDIAPAFSKLKKKNGQVNDELMRRMLDPKALDDAGSLCAAMIKSLLDGSKTNLRPMIDNYMDFIMNKEYRLADGTFARVRPQYNSMWLDDMFMSIPAIVYMGKLTGDKKYYDEAVKQFRQFSSRMFVPETGLYRHAWIESSSDHPAFYWGRANGWALLTATILLDVLPADYPGRDFVLDRFRAHVRGLAACQAGEGMWHQLLNRNDSYLETSATAIYTYCFAKAINSKWIDAIAYGPVAQLAWNAIAKKVNAEGQVEGTCVGTGMGFDPAYYYYRPVSVFAAHGYGSVLLAGAEFYRMQKMWFPKMNDSAVQYYDQDIKTDRPIFDVKGSVHY